MIICSFGGYKPTVNYYTRQEQSGEPNNLRGQLLELHPGTTFPGTLYLENFPALQSGNERAYLEINKFVLNFNFNAENTGLVRGSKL